MLHKNLLSSLRSGNTDVNSLSYAAGSLHATPTFSASAPPARLTLVPAGSGDRPRSNPSALLDLVAIAASRCASFLAEAAVLVLVLALLDRFMLKGRMELHWVVSAFTISFALLGASILLEFTARRWLRHH